MKKFAVTKPLALAAVLLPAWILAGPKADGACSCADACPNVRIKEFKIAMQCWTFHKFTFDEAVEKTRTLGIRYLEAYPGQPLSASMPGAVFDHHMTAEQRDWVRGRLNDAGIRLVAYGVVSFGPTEPEAREVFDFARDMGIEVINTEPAWDDWSILDRLVKEYGIKVSIHNHPTGNDWSRFGLPQTVLDHVKGLDRRIGSGADTGHWMRSGVDPLEALRLLRGRVVHCHLKDLNAFGKAGAHDVPFGSGKAGIRDILAELTLQDYDGYLTIEHENEAELMNPSPSIDKGLRYVDSVTYFKGYLPLVKRWNGSYNLHGWNHYGPGYFLIDPETGVLTGQDGMGLLWFSERMFGDFTLELDYQVSEVFSNSGVFLRVPEMPVSDDYIYKSFEIQIDDASTGIHNTAAVYDAVAPSARAFHEPGVWNHCKITFQGKRITVELNGVKVTDWEARPAGKIRSFADRGYIGLQNHDSRAPVRFRNIYVKEL
jgi:sugar phosphate isomerase/epimerase